MTSFKRLMDEFPDGMAGLYRQELQTLHPDSRHILLVALRWMVCGEGRISAGPIADELEHTFLDEDGSDEDEETLSKEENGHETTANESDDGNSSSAGDEGKSIEDDSVKVDEDTTKPQDEDDNKSSHANDANDAKSPGNDEASQSETNTSDDTEDQESRESINILKNVSRNFLKFDKEDHISLQHASVRDFILSESKHLDREETLCPRCRERFGSLSTAEASPRHGHLFMAIHCLKMLNCHAFQKIALPQSILKEHWLSLAQAQDESQDVTLDRTDDQEANEEKHSDATMPNSGEEKGEAEVAEDSSGKPNAQEAAAKEGVDTTDHTLKAETDTDQSKEPSEADHGDDAESVQYAATDAGSMASFQAMSEAANEDESLRYEVTRWHYHVREAEKLWPQDERDEDQWQLFMTN